MNKLASWAPAGGLHLEPNALRAVKETKASVAVTAGPGAGKTELLAQRADFLLRTARAPYPYRILAISFKRDASRNLKARVRLRCGASMAHRFDSFTFHAFAKGLIDRFRGALTGMDRLDADYNIGDKRYQESQITFADLVPLALQILRDCDVALNAVRQTYSHVFLDEFQDCTDRQYSLIKEAFLGTEIPITAVGDTKQRIMAWAGALEGITQTFATDFAATRLNLYLNFRSKPRLRRMQNEMVKVMEPEAAVAEADLQGDEGEIQVLHFENANEEAEAVADAINGWIAEEGVAPAEIAVLVRQQPHLYGAALMHALRRRSVAFRNDQELQDLSAEPLTRLLVDFLLVGIGEREPDAYQRLMAMLQDMDRGEIAEDKWSRWDVYIREGRIAFRNGARDLSAAQDLGERFLDACGTERLRSLSPEYEQGSRLEEVRVETFRRVGEQVHAGAGIHEALRRFSDDCAVRIMTVHKSKGLEFDTVVILGVERETFWGDVSASRAEFFVAISRAKRRLVLTFCDSRARPEETAGRWDVMRRPNTEFLSYADHA